MPASLRSPEDANNQALVESYLNTHPEATLAEAVAAVPGAEETYEYLRTPADDPVDTGSTLKESETEDDWFFANPKADDAAAQAAGKPAENEVVLDDEAKKLAEDPDPDFDPAEATVEEVVGFVAAHPDQADEVLEAEKKGKNRKTVFAKLDD